MSQQNPNVLPHGVVGNFKNIRKLYDQNQCKRALKQAELVLRSAPNHGETLSLKGLVLNSLNRKQEAFKFARKGVRFDVKNHLCWHILGILHRTDKNYLEAAVCFETALALQKDDPEIVRDLTIVHIQNRNYDAFFKMSNKILTLKSSIRGNWGAFAAAAHFAKEYETALKILDSYLLSIEKPDKDKVNERDLFEKSEVLFYKVIVIEDSGDIKKAKEELEKNKATILDKEEWKIKRAEYYLKLSEYDAAAQQYKVLLKGNPDNLNYYLGFFKSLQLVPESLKTLRENVELSDPQKTDSIVTWCEKFAKENPYTKIPHQIPLSFLSGDLFREKFKKFIFPMLTKGVPSLFMLVKYLYADPAKVKIIEEVLLEVEKNLLSSSKLAPTEELLEPPTTTLWTWYFLAEHFNYLHQTNRALEYAKKGQEHTPTVLDFELLKGKIYKRAGDVISAAHYIEEARSMDLADRYLNTKATRYFLRADDIKKAEGTISIFTKVEQDNNAYRNNIFDMQVVWYEFEEGLSWMRQRNFGMALKRFTDIEKQFVEIHSDQFDFHSFCHRKMTLRQYCKMLKFEDNLWGHNYYLRAAKKIVEIYLNIHINPSIKAGKATEEGGDNLTEGEKKKMQRKLKKEQAKQQQQQEEEKKANPNKPVDPDPHGEKLLNVSDPLSAADKYMKQILRFSYSSLDTHILAYQLALARKKYLLALRSVLKAQSIAPEDPDVHFAVVRFFHEVSSLIPTLPPAVAKVIQVEQADLLGSQTLAQFNDNFLKTPVGASVAGQKVYVQSALLINTPSAALKKKLLPILTNSDPSQFALNECIATHKFLLKEFDEQSAQAYKEKCLALYPYALYFSDKKPQFPDPAAAAAVAADPATSSATPSENGENQKDNK